LVEENKSDVLCNPSNNANLKVSQPVGWFQFIRWVLWWALAAVPVATISYRISLTKMDSMTFSFNDFMTFLLAAFSIGLSVLFYFKATETSNQFYHRVLDFMQNTSFVLGKMQVELNDKLSKIYENSAIMASQVNMLTEGKQAIAIKTTEKKQKEMERESIYNEIFEKAGLDENDRKDFMDKIKNKELEILTLGNEIEDLHEKISDLKNLPHSYGIHNNECIDKELVHLLICTLGGPEMVCNCDNEQLINIFQQNRDSLPTRISSILQELGIINRKFDLTIMGIEELKSYAKRLCQ